MKPTENVELKCHKCGEAVQSHWKICPVCETRLAMDNCPHCNFSVKVNWKQCPECETRLICEKCGNRLSVPAMTCLICDFRSSHDESSLSRFVDPIANMEFEFIEGGMFMMGDMFGVGLEDELPVHEVTVSPFYMAKYPVTQAQWLRIMPENPSAFIGENRPVEKVSWFDVQLFIQKFSDLSKVEGHTYRLPTEAEWEYAARSKGCKEKYAGGDQIDPLAWFDENSDGKTHPVGEKRPNGCGLFDMCGNVWEWCQDIYDKKAYTNHLYQNPVTTGESTNRVIRGGSWNQDAWSARCSRRLAFQQEFYGPGLGFRLVRATEV